MRHESDPTVQAHSGAGQQHRRVYGPIMLAVVCGFGTLVLLNPSRDGGPLLSQAAAQNAVSGRVEPGEDPTGRVTAAEQRKDIIAQLRTLNMKMERIESMLNRGLSVKVTEMPPIRLPAEEK